MSRVRIVCKAPPQPPVRAGYPRVGLWPSIGDCEIYLVDDDGTERSIDGITDVSWAVNQREVTQATLHILGVEIDAVGELPFTSPTGCPECGGLGRVDPYRMAPRGTDNPACPVCTTCNGSGWVTIRAAVAP